MFSCFFLFFQPKAAFRWIHEGFSLSPNHSLTYIPSREPTTSQKSDWQRRTWPRHGSSPPSIKNVSPSRQLLLGEKKGSVNQGLPAQWLVVANLARPVICRRTNEMSTLTQRKRKKKTIVQCGLPGSTS